MNGRPLTDAQISQALRSHLPEAAPSALRERVFDAAAETAQLRSLPPFLGALSYADPVSRRRGLLIAAALLVALAVASAAAVGAWRLLQRDHIEELSLEPPTDVPAFVLSSYERLLELPPVALAWRDSSSAKGRIYVDQSGAVRFDRFTSAGATEPSSYTILSGNRISGMALVDSQAVWIEPGHEAVDDNAREYIRGVLNAGSNAADRPGCEMERDPGEVGDGTAATGWRYVGVEYVAGRPTHHVACVGGLSVDTDLWLDVETRLILRVRHPVGDDTGQPISGQFETTEVTEITFGEQPSSLFEAPEGVAHLTSEAYSAYLCTRDVRFEEEVGLGVRDCSTPEAEATPPPEPAPTPMPTAPPASSDCAVPSGDQSEPIGPVAWTPESLKEDWPAPVRPEPDAGASILPMILTYLDPSGDTGSDAFPCVDIRGVMADTSEVHLKLDSGQPVVDPAKQWMAYGVVTDDDRDGVPDWRYGIDNNPAFGTEVPGDVASRWWRTDLHTGRTDAGGMDVRGSGNWLGADFKSVYPSGSDASFLFGGALDTTQGSVPWGFELDMPFYTWASVIVNGRVVATDYAPDSGWLVATHGSTPGGTFLLGDPFPQLSMTVPDGLKGDSGGLHSTDGEAFVRFDVIDNPEDLCSDTIKPPLGPSFDDLVTYVAGLPTIVVSENADVTVDGFRGKHLQYDTSHEADVDCAFAGISIDAFDNVWILDVDGVHLLIVYRADRDVPEEAVKIRQMVESIHFER